LQLKVEGLSVELNPNVAVGVVIVDPPAGPLVIVVFGAVVSTVNVVAADPLPLALVAVTVTVWVAALRPE
jgi:hypothetical protein